MSTIRQREIIEDWIALSAIADLERETADALWEFPQKQMRETLPIVRHLMGKDADPDEDYTDTEFFRDRLREADHMLELARASHFTLAFSFFENAMVTFARDCLIASGTNWTWSEIYGRGIEKCKTIIQRTRQADEVFSSQEWRSVCAHHAVRNIIAHSAGVTAKSDKNAKAISSLSGIRKKFLDADQDIFQLKLDEYFVRDAIEIFQNFLETLAKLKPSHP